MVPPVSKNKKKCADGNISSTISSFYKKQTNQKTPNPIIVVGKQMTSLVREAKVSPIVTTLLYFAWKGSSNVTHRFSLIGLAKKKPPKEQHPKNTLINTDKRSGTADATFL